MLSQIEMKINGLDISQFGGRLLDYSVGGTNITKTTTTTYACLLPTVCSTEISTRQLSITIVFHPYRSGRIIRAPLQERFNASTSNMSDFEALFIDNTPVEILLPDGFYYSCIIQSFGTPSNDKGIYDNTYTFTAVRHGALNVVNLTSTNNKIVCESNVKTPCKMTIVSSVSSTKIIVAGISISNVYKDTPIIIDSVKKTVTLNDCNKFADTNLITFPILAPGLNVISVPENVTVTISYYPTFV